MELFVEQSTRWMAFLLDFPRGNEAAKVFVEEIVMEYVVSN